MLDKKNLEELREYLTGYTPPDKMSLVYSREIWVRERETTKEFNWTDKELDCANENGYLGERLGFNCYINVFIK